jgi:hypothetical protein
MMSAVKRRVDVSMLFQTMLWASSLTVIAFTIYMKDGKRRMIGSRAR